MPVQLHRRAEVVARGLTRAGRVKTGPWGFDAADGDALLTGRGRREPDWDRFGAFHLARNTDHPRDTKEGWAYPVAKLVEGRAYLFRRGLIAARSRASQQGVRAVQDAAGRLLDLLDRAERRSHVFSGVFTPPTVARQLGEDDLATLLDSLDD